MNMFEYTNKTLGVIHVGDFSRDEKIFVEAIADTVLGLHVDAPVGEGVGVFAENELAYDKFWRLYNVHMSDMQKSAKSKGKQTHVR